MNARTAYLFFLALFAAERLVELVISTTNARRARRRGAVELGQGHYPILVAFHSVFLVACAVVALRYPPPPPVALLAALGAVAAQALRWWTIATLGRRWNIRILALSGEPPITGGPYHWIRHPNYLAVILEMALVPLAWGAWRTALVFSAGNALLLGIRIPVEERALGSEWAREFAEKGRLVPSRSHRRSGLADSAPGRAANDEP